MSGMFTFYSKPQTKSTIYSSRIRDRDKWLIIHPRRGRSETSSGGAYFDPLLAGVIPDRGPARPRVSPSMVPHRDQRRTLEIDGQYLKQHVRHRLVGLVEDGVVDIARFEEEIARTVNDGLVGQHVGHVARGHLADARAFVIVLAHMPAGRERQ